MCHTLNISLKENVVTHPNVDQNTGVDKYDRKNYITCAIEHTECAHMLNIEKMPEYFI